LPDQDHLPSPSDNDSRNSKALSLAEGAILIALAVICGLIVAYVPLLTLIAPLFFPLPIAILYLRQGSKIAITATVCIFLILLALAGIATAAYLMLQFGFLGLFFGFCFQRRTRPLFTLTVATIIAGVGMMLSILLALRISGLPFDYLQTFIKEFAGGFTQAIVDQGAESVFFGTMTAAQYTVYLEDLFLRFIPSFLIITAMITGLICYLFCSAIMRRLHYDIRPLPSFRNWRIDWRLMWGIVVALLIAGIGGFLDSQLLRDIGNNVLIVFCPILIICGLSFCWWLLKSFKAPLWIIIILVFFCIQFTGTLIFILLVGALDAVFNFRMRITNFRDKISKGE